MTSFITSAVARISSSGAELLDAVGAALLHSLWQVALIGLGYFLATRLIRSAQLRHIIGMGCLLFSVAWPASTFLKLASSSVDSFVVATAPTAVAAQLQAPESATQETTALTTHRARFPNMLTATRSALALAWGVGVLLMLTRLAFGIETLRRLKRSTTPAEFEEAFEGLQARLESIAANLGSAKRFIHRVRLKIVDHDVGPCTFGLVRATIVVPTSALSGLPSQHLDAILLHELMHIQRKDTWIATIHAALDCLLFFHPVARLVSRSTRLAREQACDDAVIAAGRQRETYAEALLSLARTRTVVPGVAAGDSDLQLRVRRILQLPAESSTHRELPGTVAALAALVVPVALMASAVATVGGTPAGAEPNEHFTAQAQIMMLDRDALIGSDLHLSPYADSQLLIGTVSTSQLDLIQQATLETLSVPSVIGRVGTSTTITSGLADPNDSEVFRDQDGVPLNALLELTLRSHGAAAGVLVSSVDFALRPALGTVRRSWSDRDFEATLPSLALRQAQPLLVVEAIDPSEDRPALAILLSMRLENDQTETAHFTPPKNDPVTLTVKDADLPAVLTTLTRYAKLELVIAPDSDKAVDRPVTITAIAVPVRQLISSTLAINCLEGTYAGSTLVVSAKPGCSTP